MLCVVRYLFVFNKNLLSLFRMLWVNENHLMLIRLQVGAGQQECDGGGGGARQLAFYPKDFHCSTLLRYLSILYCKLDVSLTA